MEKATDLHIHSHFSEDADLSIEEIFKLAQESSISAISIADHDSIKSIEPAKTIQKKYPVEYIPGVEITTVLSADGSQQHILGYFVDDKNPVLLEALKKIGELRLIITQKRIDAIKNIDFVLDEDRIWNMAGGRPPSATSIMIELFRNEKNSNDKRLYDYLHGNKKESRISHFYRDYFTEGGPAYVPFQSISVKEGVDVIKSAGGIPVIAHPIFVKNKEWLDIITDSGIMGIEAVSTYHKKNDVEFYTKYAEEHNLIITSGSDFHGPTSKPHIKLGGQSDRNFRYFEDLKNFYINR